MEPVDNEALSHEIIAQLRYCGHFLYYRMGGRAGRRRILTKLSEHSEILQKDLQEIMEVQSGSLSEMIIGMEADGLVEKIKSERDGRRLVLRLTPKGRVQAEQAKEEYNRRIETMMGCFSEEQKQELNQLLRVMQAHWRSIENEWDLLSVQEQQKKE